jgi:hypothetical protein
MSFALLNTIKFNRPARKQSNKARMLILAPLIRKARQSGMTLAAVGEMFGVSGVTVYNYTKDIVHANRRDVLDLVNRRTGATYRTFGY